MANECTVRTGLTIRNGNLRYNSTINGFTADMTGAKGPTPGAIAVSLSGTDIDFSQLARPGWCEFINLDATNRVEVGVYEPGTNTFYPFLELLPGEANTVRLSRNIHEQTSGTVTGTGTDATNNTTRAKAYGAAVNLYVGAFEA